MDTSYVAVAVVTSRTEAELIAGLLRSNGLRAAVSADRLTGKIFSRGAAHARGQALPALPG